MVYRHRKVLVLLTCLLVNPLAASGQPAEMVQDIYPGFTSGLFGLAPCFPTGGFSEPGYFLEVRGNKLLFTARDEEHGIELWQANSSWHLSLLADIAEGPEAPSQTSVSPRAASLSEIDCSSHPGKGMSGASCGSVTEPPTGPTW